MTRIMEARMVRLEGVESPCILLVGNDEIPEELVVNFGDTEAPGRGPTTFRLEPSSAGDAEPLYRALFEE